MTDTLPENLINALKQAVTAQPNHPFLVYRSGAVLEQQSFTHFYNTVEDWAGFLQKRKVKHGERVLIVSQKNPAQIRLFYACWLLGAIAVPICETLGADEMQFIVKDCKPALVVIQDELKALDDGRFGKSLTTTFDDILEYQQNHEKTALKHLKPATADETAALIYTSGSTGNPKGVMLTHRNFMANAASASRWLDLGKNDTCLSILPYWHSFALTVEVVMPCFNHFSVAFAKDRRDFMKSISVYNPSVILVVPRIIETIRQGIEKKMQSGAGQLIKKWIAGQIRHLKNHKEQSLSLLNRPVHALLNKTVFPKIQEKLGKKFRYFVSGGAPLDQESQLFFQLLNLPVYQGYGLTESSPVISVNRTEDYRPGSCGKVLDWLTADYGGDFTFLNDQGETGRTQSGELLVKGDCVMAGYWHHQDESAKTLEGGWLHTGDMAYLDSDGFLYIDGRKGNMIVLKGGEKAHPEPIENAIKHSPLIAEAMVFGEGCKNLYAIVNLSEEAQNLDEHDLNRQIKRDLKNYTAHLPPFQQPRHFLVVPDFSTEDETLTPTLKIRRHKIKAREAEALTAFLRNQGETF